MKDLHKKFLQLLEDPDPGFLEKSSLSELLYENYAEETPIEDEAICCKFAMLDELLKSLSLQDNNALYCEIVEVCIINAKKWFAEGLIIGFHYQARILPVLLGPTQKASSMDSDAFEYQFSDFLHNYTKEELENSDLKAMMLLCLTKDRPVLTPEIYGRIQQITMKLQDEPNVQRDIDVLIKHLCIAYCINAFRGGVQVGISLEKEIILQ